VDPHWIFNPVYLSIPFTDVCYLRLDFESFTLLGPTDSLVNTAPGVTGANAEVLGGSCSDTFKVVVSQLSFFVSKLI
jgi:hypothetical protein